MYWDSLRKIPAMLWELWRASRWELLLKFGIVAGFLLLIASLGQDFGETQRFVLRAIALVTASIACVFSTTWLSDIDDQASGFTFRLGFSRPISTFQLVAVPMGYAVVTALLGYVICVFLVFALLKIWLPIPGPAAAIGCFVCCCIACVWASTHAIEKIIAIFLVVMVAVGVLAWRHRMRSAGEPILLALGGDDFFAFAWWEYVLLAACASSALATTVCAVRWQRCGEGLSWIRWLALVVQRLVQSSRWSAMQRWLETRGMPAPGAGPLRTQVRFELRRTAHLLFLICLCSAAVFAFVSLVPLVNTSWGGEHSPRLWLGAMLISPLLYQIVAIDPVAGLRHKQGGTELSIFDAIQPLRCDQVMTCKLLVVAGWSLVGLCIMCLAAAMHATLAGQWQEWRTMLLAIVEAISKLASATWQPSATSATAPIDAFAPEFVGQLQRPTLGWCLVGLVNVMLWYCFSTTALMASVFFMAKFPRVAVVIGMVSLGHLGLWAWDISHERPLAWLWLGYAYLLPSALMVAAMVVIGFAAQGQLLSRRYLAVVVCVWSVFVACNVALSWRISALLPDLALHPLAIVGAVAGLAVALAVAVASPLAYAAFRNA